MALMLVLPFLLVSALGGVGAQISTRLHSNRTTMTWTEARTYCQEKYLDLVTFNDVEADALAQWLLSVKIADSVWIGLHRDPDSEGDWNWIDQSTAEGLSDQTASVNWTIGGKVLHCAAVTGDRFQWYSENCSTSFSICCSNGSKITCPKLPMSSWLSAKSACEDNLLVLPTVTAENTQALLNNSWIGLRRDGGDIWKWHDGTALSFTNWAPGEPRTKDCASFDSTSELSTSCECSEKLRSVCFGDNLVVVKMKKTWEEALSHCREMETECLSGGCTYRYDLLMPKNDTERAYVASRVQRTGITSEVWVGLRFLAGKWWGLDGWNASQRLTLPDCPSHWEHCAAVKHDSNNWLVRDCLQTKYFVCHGHIVGSAASEPASEPQLEDAAAWENSNGGEKEEEDDDD